nr:formin-like protein [Tanacetum cinerariifolium]
MNSDTSLDEKDNGMHWSMIIIGLSVVASTVLFIVGLVVAYKYWQKRKRQREQARFMKLFEDTDDIEDELAFNSASNDAVFTLIGTFFEN